jgi:peptidoglycan DL-endopeptidase CwlO
MTAVPCRWLAPVLAVIAAAAIVLAPAAPAAAQPGGSPTPEESDTPLLRDVLDATGRGYLKAKATLDASKKQQLRLSLEVRRAQSRIDELGPQVGQMAAQAYRTGRLSAAVLLLNSSSPDTFLQRAAALDELNMVNDQKLQALTAARDQLARAKTALDAEVKRQQVQVNVMAKQKSEAEKALALVGGDRLTDGFVVATSPVAKAAPRTADGGWPDESCSKDDPTTSGCVTPRTLNAYTEARKAGFTRFVGCYRAGGPYEHPKGRACDWSLRSSGFSPAANQDQKTYGNNLTAFLVRNADRLGVLYVIWYRQIWFPATGWQAYTGPKSHTDHVHMSMV